jgi:hypothetical protein
MPLSIDLEADLDELCAEALRPWAPLTVFYDPAESEGDGLDLPVESFGEALSTLAGVTQPLRALRIVGKEATPEQLTALLRLAPIATLEALMLPMCRLGPEGAKAIAARSLPRLRLLDLRQTALGDEGAIALATAAIAARLEHLSVAGSFLTVAGLSALLASPLGTRAGALDVEEEDQPESLVPTLMTDLYGASHGDAQAAEAAFARMLAQPALTEEARAELRYQWDLVMSSG